eukprot:m.5176 g.5176  ORF g.5176 m.5176 type:complete len:66 (-) comp4850_c0_seq1:491-688(-)
MKCFSFGCVVVSFINRVVCVSPPVYMEEQGRTRCAVTSSMSSTAIWIQVRVDARAPTCHFMISLA